MLELFFIPIALLCCGVSFWLLMEVVAARVLRRRSTVTTQRPPVDILIPAHNEAGILPTTLTALADHTRPDDRVWVIADNCNDDTADVARTHGVHVIERHHATERGKGYAMQHALDGLRDDHAEVIVMLDADCRFGSDSLDVLVRATAHHRGPTQSIYLMTTADSASPAGLSQFALVLKNYVRPAGLSRLGLPCLLTGSGMAFPWEALASVNLANANTADDMELTCDLALAGFLPRLCEEAAVTADLPTEDDASSTQRRRWIHGHLSTALRYVPRLLLHGVRRFSLSTMALAIEVAVPPLSLFVMMLMLTTLLVGASLLFTGPLLTGPAFALLACTLAAWVMFIAAIGVAWTQHATGHLPIASLVGLPVHMLRTIVAVLAFPFRRQHWTPTPRDIADPQEGTTTA